MINLLQASYDALPWVAENNLEKMHIIYIYLCGIKIYGASGKSACDANGSPVIYNIYKFCNTLIHAVCRLIAVISKTFIIFTA